MEAIRHLYTEVGDDSLRERACILLAFVQKVEHVHVVTYLHIALHLHGYLQDDSRIEVSSLCISYLQEKRGTSSEFFTGKITLYP